MRSRLFSLLSEVEKPSVLKFTIVVSAMIAIIDVLTIALIFPILLIVVRPRDVALPDPFSRILGPAPDTTTLYILAGVLVGLVIAKNIATVGTTWLQTRLASRMMQRLSAVMIQGYLSAPLEYHMKRKTGQYMRGLRDLPSDVCFLGWLSYCGRIAELAGVAAILLSVAVLQPLGMAAAAVFLGVLALVNYRLFGARFRRWGVQTGRLTRLTYGLVSQTFPSIKVIKTTEAEAQMEQRFKTLADEGAIVMARIKFGHLVLRPVSEIIMMGAAIIVLVSVMIGRDRVIEAVPFLAVFTYAIFRLLPAVNRISSCTNELKRMEPTVDELQAELDGIRALPDDRRRNRAIRFDRTLELRDISYRYPESSIPALEDVSAVIPFGGIVGVVGPSGAGKSTLIDMMLGLLEPSSGEILYDGEHRHGFSGKSNAVGYVPQHSPLLDLSARENVAFGLDADRIDDAEVRRAIRAAMLSDVVSQWPDGIDTALGEFGSQLSGGQRQRFGIARALYGKPSLLVMDEATSDLDSRTEYEVSRAIEQLRGTTTIVLVAHRLHLLKSCDVIFYMEEGRIVARGTYDRLMRECGAFRDLAQIIDRYGKGEKKQRTPEALGI